MGIFGKLFKKKRNEDEQVDYEGGEEDFRTEVPPWSRGYEEQFQQRPNRFGSGQEWQQPQQNQQQTGNEIIIAKLDLINAKLDSLNQRLANLERYATEDEKDKSRSRW